jgi:hypothetical protein
MPRRSRRMTGRHVRKFQTHYPEWRYGYNLEELIGEIRATLEDRAGSQAS